MKENRKVYAMKILNKFEMVCECVCVCVCVCVCACECVPVFCMHSAVLRLQDTYCD